VLPGVSKLCRWVWTRYHRRSFIKVPLTRLVSDVSGMKNLVIWYESYYRKLVVRLIMEMPLPFRLKHVTRQTSPLHSSAEHKRQHIKFLGCNFQLIYFVCVCVCVWCLKSRGTKIRVENKMIVLHQTADNDSNWQSLYRTQDVVPALVACPIHFSLIHIVTWSQKRRQLLGKRVPIPTHSIEHSTTIGRQGYYNALRCNEFGKTQ
jgi:hypothetical protein